MRKYIHFYCMLLLLVIFAGCNKEKPQAAFEMSPVSDDYCVVQVGEEVIFTNKSTNADAYEWHFGDNDESTVENPKHSYDEIGAYWVTLVASNDDGLSQASGKVYVEEYAEGLVINVCDSAAYRSFEEDGTSVPSSKFISGCSVWFLETLQDYNDLFDDIDNSVYSGETDASGKIVFEDFKTNQKYYIVAYKKLSNGYLLNTRFTSLTSNTKKLQTYTFPVHFYFNPTKLTMTVLINGTTDPLTNADVYLFDSYTDYSSGNTANAIDSAVTDVNGEVSFTDLEAQNYYYYIEKTSGSGLYTNNASGMTNSTGTLIEHENNEKTVYAKYIEPFYSYFNNQTSTPIEITISKQTKTIPVDGSVTFVFESNPGSYSYSASTQGETPTGNPFGDEIEWNYTHTVRGMDFKLTDLVVGPTHIFFSMTNCNSSNNIYAVAATCSSPSYWDYETYSIPNDGIERPLGYFPTYDLMKVNGYYSGTDHVYWSNLSEYFTEEDNLTLNLVWDCNKKSAPNSDGYIQGEVIKLYSTKKYDENNVDLSNGQ